MIRINSIYSGSSLEKLCPKEDSASADEFDLASLMQTLVTLQQENGYVTRYWKHGNYIETRQDCE